MGRRPLGRDRINITLPPEIAEALMNVAAEQSRDRSALIEELARDYLRKIGRTPAAKVSDAGKRKRGGK